MKKIFLLLVSIFSIGVLSSFAQVIDTMLLKCQYRLLYVRDSMYPDEIQGDVMNLEVGRKISKFYSYDDFKSDSILDAAIKANKPKEEIVAGRSFRINYNTYVVYTNYPEGKITVTDKIMRDYYKYLENFPAVTWKIYPETTTILDYPCQKAECRFRGRTYTVWFTNSIPVHFGPWKLSGLPGLILKAEDSQQHFVFECISIVNPRSVITWEDRKYQLTDHKKFNQAYIRFKQNPLLGLQGMGIEIEIPNAPKKPFNPLELKDE